MVILDVDGQLLTSDNGTQTPASVVASHADATVETKNDTGKTAQLSSCESSNSFHTSRGWRAPRAPGRGRPKEGEGGVLAHDRLNPLRPHNSAEASNQAECQTLGRFTALLNFPLFCSRARPPVSCITALLQAAKHKTCRMIRRPKLGQPLFDMCVKFSALGPDAYLRKRPPGIFEIAWPPNTSEAAHAVFQDFRAPAATKLTGTRVEQAFKGYMPRPKKGDLQARQPRWGMDEPPLNLLTSPSARGHESSPISSWRTANRTAHMFGSLYLRPQLSRVLQISRSCWSRQVIGDAADAANAHGR